MQIVCTVCVWFMNKVKDEKWRVACDLGFVYFVLAASAPSAQPTVPPSVPPAGQPNPSAPGYPAQPQPGHSAQPGQPGQSLCFHPCGCLPSSVMLTFPLSVIFTCFCLSVDSMLFVMSTCPLSVIFTCLCLSVPCCLSCLPAPCLSYLPASVCLFHAVCHVYLPLVCHIYLPLSVCSMLFACLPLSICLFHAVLLCLPAPCTAYLQTSVFLSFPSCLFHVVCHVYLPLVHCIYPPLSVCSMLFAVSTCPLYSIFANLCLFHAVCHI